LEFLRLRRRRGQERQSDERRTYPGHVGYASAPGRVFMSNHALFLVRMDIAHDHEATFNEVYDREHAPNLRGVPGVRRAARYRQPSPTEPRYLAAYELDSLAVLDSPAWKKAGEAGRGPGNIRPNRMTPHLTKYA